MALPADALPSEVSLLETSSLKLGPMSLKAARDSYIKLRVCYAAECYRTTVLIGS